MSLVSRMCCGLKSLLGMLPTAVPCSILNNPGYSFVFVFALGCVYTHVCVGCDTREKREKENLSFWILSSKWVLILPVLKVALPSGLESA